MNKSLQILATLAFAMFVCVATSQAGTTLVSIGFEQGEYNNVEYGNPLWGDGSSGTVNTHGSWVPLTSNPSEAFGSFSIPGENTRWQVDASNARTGSQSAILGESAVDSYQFYIFGGTGQGREEIDNQTLPVRLAWSTYRAQTGDDLRSNGVSSSSDELWQFQIANDGNVIMESGSGSSSSNPGDLTGWYDVEMDVDFTKNSGQIIGARFSPPGSSLGLPTGTFTELITGSPLDFKGGLTPSTLGAWFFRPDNAGVSALTAWDDLSISVIPEPSSALLLITGVLGLVGLRRRR